MKVTPSLQHKIEEATGNLQWELRHEVVKGATICRITSDPHRRQHIIHLPDPPDEVRGMDYLHELAHATLAEKHYLLSTSYFMRGTPVKYCEMMADSEASAMGVMATPEMVAAIKEHYGLNDPIHVQYLK